MSVSPSFIHVRTEFDPRDRFAGLRKLRTVCVATWDKVYPVQEEPIQYDMRGISVLYEGDMESTENCVIVSGEVYCAGPDGCVWKVPFVGGDPSEETVRKVGIRNLLDWDGAFNLMSDDIRLFGENIPDVVFAANWLIAHALSAWRDRDRVSLLRHIDLEARYAAYEAVPRIHP